MMGGGERRWEERGRGERGRDRERERETERWKDMDC